MGTRLERGYVVEGRYRLETLLGEGGYGAVWKAIQLNVNRPVAIKFLKAIAADLSATRRFEREAQALGRLQHPNCVTMLDYGQGEAGTFLVTEYLDGERLDHWAEGDHDLATIFTIAYQVLAALDHAHQQRIIHRDLKPANIVVSENAEGELVAKVLDFGIASVVGARRGDITKTGEVFGTPGYMAPEQLLGEDKVGPTADLYSFGVVLYQIVEQRKLFTAGSGIEVALKHLTHEPPRMERAIPDGLQEIVTRLLSKQPSERFQSAEEVTRALQRVGSTEVAAHTFAEAPPPGFHPQRPIPQPARPTPPTRPTGYHGNATGPMGHAPMGYHGGSSSDGHVRPSPPTATDSYGSLGQVAIGLIVITGALSVIAYNALSEKAPSVPTVNQTNKETAATGLLRREYTAPVNVEPLPTRVKVEPYVPDAGADAATISATSVGCGGEKFRAGFQSISLMTGPLETRQLYLYIPKGYDPNKPHRALLAFHDTRQFARGLFTELNLGPPADRDGVVIIFPEQSTWANPWKSSDDWDDAEADLRSARSAVCLDDEVMLFGFGSGAHAAQQLACRLPGASVLVQSTYRKLEDVPVCDHSRLPYLVLAPTKDGRDPEDGGPGCMGGDDVVSVDEHEAIYRQLYECSGPAREEFRQQGSVCQTWDCKSPFVFCRLNGGRPLPNQADYRLSDCEGRPAKFPYRDKIWEFLMTSKITAK